MSTEHLIKHFGEILQQMEAVGDLSRPRGACTGSVDEEVGLKVRRLLDHVTSLSFTRRQVISDHSSFIS
jgi:hypothetical protein